MKRPLLAALVGLALSAGVSVGATDAPPAPNLESLQRQIDDLKKGQERLLDELRALRQSQASAPERRETAVLPDAPKLITLNVRGEPFRGAPAARVAIVEYSDFNCSFCAKFATNVYPQLARDYVSTGKVRYLFRDLPDKLDDDSVFKAQAVRCAGEQGKFWELHDRLFADPAPLFNDPVAVERHAAALGLDAAKLGACLQSHRYLASVQRGADAARRFGLNGTPGFLIGRTSENGEVVWGSKLVVGAESYEPLRAELEAFLAEPRK